MKNSIAYFIGVLFVLGLVGCTTVENGNPHDTQQKMDQTEQPKAPQSSNDKIDNAMSAGTPAIAHDATVLDWPTKDGGDLVELRKGTNSWTCLPDMPSSPGNDPMCMDAQGMKWVQALVAHKDPNLTQPGVGYMLQGASDASNTDPFATQPASGEDWVSAPAHVMYFPTGTLDTSVYGTDPKKGSPWIMFAGTPYNHLMVPVK